MVKNSDMFIVIANVTVLNVYRELLTKTIIMQRGKCTMEV